MCGTGEYTTGWTGSGASTSDKKIGVVALTLFDLRRRGKVDKLGMVGVNGNKFPAIRAYLQENVGQVYKDLDISFHSFPGDNEVDPEACAYRHVLFLEPSLSPSPSFRQSSR
ncbi:hypothetical protein BGW80DRAFT_30204 [Lactifluus volemus]|nr:hypothetical protein BGW80DRAFT_30204 [Lactifluus volemus]